MWNFEQLLCLILLEIVEMAWLAQKREGAGNQSSIEYYKRCVELNIYLCRYVLVIHISMYVYTLPLLPNNFPHEHYPFPDMTKRKINGKVFLSSSSQPFWATFCCNFKNKVLEYQFWIMTIITMMIK